MRTSIILLVSFLWFIGQSTLIAQSDCDIFTTGISSVPDLLPVSGQTTITFDVANDAQGSSCTYPVNSVLVKVQLPADGLSFQAFTTPVMGPYFTWSYNAGTKEIVGVNHTAIPDGQGEVITASLLATAAPDNVYPTCRVLNLSISPNPGGPGFPSNTSGNDTGLTTITITPQNTSSNVDCISNAVQPVPPFLTAGCSSPVISSSDNPPGFTCIGTRVWTFTYSACSGCPDTTFSWTHTYNVVGETMPPTFTFSPADITIDCEDSQLPADTGGPATATDNCSTPVVSYSDAAGQLIPSTFPGGTAIQGRARWGNTGYEGGLFIGGTVGPQLNPAGTPVWVIGTPYMFEYGYNGTTGDQTLKIDFNNDNSYGAGEVITQSTAFAGQGFKHFSIFMSGNATRGITLNNFVVNGVNLGNFVSPATGAIDLDWENSAGLFSNITATGTITFTGSPGSGDETGRIWWRTATPVAIPAPPLCNDNYVINRVWKAEDACGNQRYHVQNITVQDVTPPTFNFSPADTTISCDASTLPANTGGPATAMDNCDLDPDVTYDDAAGQLIPSTFPGGTAIQGRARWGNTGFEGALYIGGTVGPNLNPAGTPVWVIGTPYMFEYGYNGTTGDQTLKIDFNNDNSYGAGEVITQATGFAGQGFKHFSIFMSGDATRGINLNNFVVNGVNLGNFVSPATGNINLDWENSAGLFSNITATGTITFTGSPGPGDETGRIWWRTATPVAIPAAPTCPQNSVINRVWKAEDACGNISYHVQNITVQDVTPPTITRLGPDTVYICQNATYMDAGATALDNCSGNITGSINVNNPVNTSIAGTYTVTYTVSDPCGNAADPVTRTVIVRPHPTATISGTATVLQNAPVLPVVTFTGSGGTGPYTFDYTIQFNANPPTNHTAGPGNPVTVPQSNSVVGVFTYTLTRVTDSYGCYYDLPVPQPTAVITVIPACDLSPSIPRPISGSFTATSPPREGVVQFTNAGPASTSGTLTFRISNISNFALNIPSVSGTFAGIPCQNGSFTITPGTFFTTVTTTAVIPAGGNLRIGFIMTPSGSGGSSGNLTTTVLNGTGVDNNNANNRAVRTFVIN